MADSHSWSPKQLSESIWQEFIAESFFAVLEVGSLKNRSPNVCFLFLTSTKGNCLKQVYFYLKSVALIV